MAQVQAFKKRIEQSPAQESKAAKYGAIGGSIVGGVIGAVAGKTPGAAMGGAASGGSLGGMIGGAFGQSTPGATRESFDKQPVETSDSAMSRKLEAARQERLAVLRQAEAALPQLDPELRRQYAQPIIEATMAEERRKAMGG
jgi:hypothetical protein